MSQEPPTDMLASVERLVDPRFQEHGRTYLADEDFAALRYVLETRQEAIELCRTALDVLSDRYHAEGGPCGMMLKELLAKCEPKGEHHA